MLETAKKLLFAVVRTGALPDVWITCPPSGIRILTKNRSMQIQKTVSARAIAGLPDGRIPLQPLLPHGIWLSLCGLVLLAGCGEQPQIRSYQADPETEKIITTEVLRNQFPAIPFRWKVPAEWQVAENDQFSVIAWTIAGNDPTSAARITLSELPGSAGLVPQIARWRGQVGLPELDPAETMKSVETLKLGDQTGSYIELPGPRETILGLIATHKNQMWVFKYRSENSTAADAGKSFRSFCESLQLTK